MSAAVPNIDLIEHLKKQNVYDLERLRECFNYELKIEPENKDAIEEILESIEQILQERNGA